MGEGITISLRRQHLFTPRAFTSLKVNQAIVKLFDGVRVLEPWVVYLKPMHENPEVSWFDTTGRVGRDPADDPRPRPRLARLRGFGRRFAEASRCLRRRPAITAVEAVPNAQTPGPQELNPAPEDAGGTRQDASHADHP